MLARTPVYSALAELRSRAGYSVRSLAEALGRPGSTYASYERSSYKKQVLPMDLVQKLRPLLVGRGEPPIRDAEVLGLGGVALPEGTDSPSPIPLIPAVDGAPAEPGATIAVPQYDVQASAGPGAEPPDHLRVVTTWTILAEFARSVSANPDHLAVIAVSGESMEPDFRNGDFVFVDTGHRQVTGGDVYVIWNGAALVIKRLEVVAGSTPLRLRILSTHPQYPPQEVGASDLHISGRVVGRLSRR